MTLAPRLTPLTPSDASAFGVEIACHEGYYNSVETPINTTELTRCTRCPDHSTTNHTGAVDASACHCRTGFTETHTANGSLVCECAAGFGIDEADDLCERCEIGKYKSEVGNHKCVECPLSADGQPVMTTVARGAVGLDDCECQPGFYRDFEAHLANGNHTCFACPRGTECAEAGVHLTELPIAPGYWRATLTTYHVRECYNPPCARSCRSPSPSTSRRPSPTGSGKTQRARTPVDSSASFAGAACALTTYDRREQQRQRSTQQMQWRQKRQWPAPLRDKCASSSG